MKSYRFAAALVALAFSFTANAQDESMVSKDRLSDIRDQVTREVNCGLAPQIQNIQGRDIICLDGKWRTIVDQFENGYYNHRLKPQPDNRTFFADKSYWDDPTKLVEYDFDTDEPLNVPGDWNTQRPELYYYEGTIWYRQKFSIAPEPGKRYFLYFGAANYETITAINGRVIGKHTGGFTPFNFEVTDLLKDGENTIVAKVDNKRHPEGVPTVNADWWNYGGITRSVYIVKTPETFVREYCLKVKDVKADSIKGWAQLDGPVSAGQQVTVEIPELKVSKVFTTDASGHVDFEFKAKPQLWSPENPVMYSISISAGQDKVSDEMGFRVFEARGNKLYLNGKQVFLRGVCMHDVQPGTGGRAFSEEHARTVLGWAKEMNCNFLRLAHYPHNEAMVRTAEKMGLMLWSEIPVYWTIHWDNPQTYTNAEQQLVDMITRDRNRASVVIWSVANETPLSDSRLAFLTRLINKAHALDDTRLVSAAMEKESHGNDLTVNDPLADVTDLVSFNQYVGWYDGSSDKCDQVNWSFSQDKPVIISEWGGGALYGYHADRTIRFSEEYQEYLYIKNISMLERIPGLAGSTPWILKDFRSPRRQLKGIQDDYNRKGLISEQGEKKKAFYVMQDWYAKLAEKYK